MVTLEQAKKIRLQQAILIEKRRQLFQVIKADESIEGNPAKLLKELGFVEAAKSYNQNEIEEKYFYTLDFIKSEIENINLKIKQLPKITLQMHKLLQAEGIF